MASDKADSAHNEHVENSEHEGVLLGVVALASLFSNCVEAFNLIRASQKWEKEEQLLLSRLGIQQARLLIWGDILGVSSPPKSVTNSAVPKHPSAAYPDLSEPTFFNARDPRLDEEGIRIEIEDALNAIVDRSAHLTREQMMEQFGLKPPKRYGSDYQPALDPTRLDAFREKYELLQEVAESYAHINTRRSNSIAMQTWVISDRAKFARFIQLTQDKIDFLVARLAVSDQVDRAMRMDIRAFGWHLTADRTRIAQDISKLKLIAEACKHDYPQYLPATQQALDNISRENRENQMAAWTPPAPTTSASAPSSPAVLHPPKSSHAAHAQSNGTANHDSGSSPHSRPATPKRPSLFSGLFRFKSTRTLKPPAKSSLLQPAPAPDRSLSDAGPVSSPPASTDNPISAQGEPIMRVRSKSVGAIVDDFGERMGNEVARRDAQRREKEKESGREREKQGQGQEQELDAGQTELDVLAERALKRTGTVESHVSRHDQFRGIGGW